MPRHSTNTCFLVHSQEKILLSLTLVRIGEMIQEMPFRMSFPHVLMAGRPQQILHGGTLKYLFGYFKIRIFYCSNRTFFLLFYELYSTAGGAMNIAQRTPFHCVVI